MNESEWMNYVIRLNIAHSIDLIFILIVFAIFVFIAFYILKRNKQYLVETKQLDKFEDWNTKRQDSIKKLREQIKKKEI